MASYSFDGENKKLRLGMIELWREGKICDLTLKTIDGKEFPVHKIVIGSISNYFRGMFNSDFAENKQKIIQLDENVASEDLELVLEFFYTGKFEFLNQLNSKTTINLYKTFIFVGIDNTKEIFLNHLIKLLSIENSLDLWRLCGCKLFESLQNKVEDYVRNNALLFLQNHLEILNISELLSILSMRDLSCSDKELCLQSVKWLKINFVEREKHLKDILTKINFIDISPEFIKNNLLGDKILLEHKDCSQIFSSILYSKLKYLNNFHMHYGLNETQHRLLVTEANFFKIDMNKEKITELNDIRREKGFSATKFEENKIFFSGGNSNKCEYFAIDRFHSLPPMLEERTKHGSIYYNDKIYCCGGESNKTTEIFDLNSIKWLRGPDMMHAHTSHCSCLRMEGAVICAYEFRLDSNCSIVQKFDTRTNIWQVAGFGPNKCTSTSIDYKNKNFTFLCFDLAGCIYLYEKSDSVFYRSRNLFQLWSPGTFVFNDKVWLFGKKHGTGKFECCSIAEWLCIDACCMDACLTFSEFKYDGNDLHIF